MDDFFSNMAEQQRLIGTYQEISCSMLILHMESTYKPEHIRNHAITKILPNGEHFLLKWEKRIIPLSDDQMAKRFETF